MLLMQIFNQVIPPGMDFSYVTTQDTMGGDTDLKSLIGNDRTQSKRNLPPIWSEVKHLSLQQTKISLSRIFVP